MSEEIKDIMDALENNELKNDGFWGRACSRLSQQLLAAKEENERLRNLLGKPYKRRIDLENNKLTQQNKQMREALEKIDGDCHFTKECTFNHNCHKCHVAFYKNIAFEARQALKGVE